MEKKWMSAGKVVPSPKGIYDAETEYKKLDVVSFNGSSWLCKKDCVGVEPSENDYWMVYATNNTEWVEWKRVTVPKNVPRRFFLSELPQFDELMIVCNTVNITFHILEKMLTSTTERYLQGCYFSNTNNISAAFDVDNEGFTLTSPMKNGATIESTYTIYIKERRIS